MEATSRPRVVKLKMKGGVEVQGCDVYIGSQMTQGGHNRKESQWRNPFKGTEKGTTCIGKYKPHVTSVVGQDADAWVAHLEASRNLTCVQIYRLYLIKLFKQDPDKWIPELVALEGLTLGCWCKPAPCHGDVLSEFVEMACEAAEEKSERFLEVLYGDGE
jgi:hypothetical protein